MVTNSITDLPHVDEDGYFDGLCACMVDATGELLLGANTFNILAPEDDGKHFYKINAAQTGWDAEVIPTTAEECLGIVLDHQSRTDRVHRLRACFDALTKDSTEFRQVQNPETNARTVERIPEKTADEVRSEKELELESAFSSWYSDGATLISSLGYEIDSDSRAMRDVNGLVTAAEAQAAFADAESGGGLIFMDANNVGHEVTLAELKTLQLEIIQAGNAAYQEKWRLRDAIASAATKEELEAIAIVFHPVDFSAS